VAGGVFEMRDYVVNFDMKNIEVVVKDFVREVEKVDGVLAVYVFGSYIKNKMHGLSDVDICVVGNISSKDKMNILLGNFPEILDISFFSDLSIWMKAKIFREGKCLMVNDSDKLNIIKLFTLGEYLDFKPVVDYIIEKELAIDVQ